MGLGDLLKGKEKTYKRDALADDINKAGKTGLNYLRSGASRLNSLYSEDPTQVVNAQIGLENRLARGAADDAIRRTRELVARRGMQNSSVGLGQEVNQQRQLSNTLGMNQASALGRIRDMRESNAQGIMNAGTGLFQTKIQGQQNLQMQDIKKRQGGIAPLVGAAIGGYYGGSEGAKIGFSAGEAYKQS